MAQAAFMINEESFSSAIKSDQIARYVQKPVRIYLIFKLNFGNATVAV